MKQITIDEIRSLNRDERIIVDIRKKEDFEGGSMEGAVNLPIEDFAGECNQLPRDKKICVLSYTGPQCEKILAQLEERGYNAAGIQGGYRRLLRRQLEEQVQDPALEERTRDIERSLIKKYRKTIWRPFTKAVTDYELIQPGDKIAVCISGGKDSMLMAKLFQEIQRHGKIPFDLVFLGMNPGYHEDNWSIIQNNARILGIPLVSFDSEIFNVVVDIDRNPCYLCARMRRGYLYSRAKEMGCNKIALGHHFDDVIETILMGMLYSGKIETMMPKLHSIHFAGMELIRPLYLIKEADIKSWRDYCGLHFIQCACRFTESSAVCSEGHLSKRDEMKALIAGFREISNVIDTNIFNSVRNINLRTVIGYHKDEMQYNFLDDYEKYASKE